MSFSELVTLRDAMHSQFDAHIFIMSSIFIATFLLFYC